MPDLSAFLSKHDPICPPGLLTKAQAGPPARVAIAAAGAALPMEAAKDAADAGILVPVFTGVADDIRRQADRLNWDISAYQIEEADGEAASAAAAASICGAGDADVLMKGHLHSDAFMKAALSRDAGLRTGSRLVHIFHISPPDGGPGVLISDAAVNVAPDLRTRKTAVDEVISLLALLGTSTPRIAFLSATESAIPSVPSSLEAAELRDWARDTYPQAQVSGPLAFDGIFSSEAAAIKGMADDPVTGQADAVIVPDIVSGNAIFKALVYLSGGCAAGVVTGAKVPILLTSRADPPAARLASVALAAILNAGDTR